MEKWERKFITYCNILGIYDILDGTEISPSDKIFSLSDAQKKSQRNNKTAYFLLMNSMVNTLDNDIVFDSRTPDLKMGDAHLDWKKL